MFHSKERLIRGSDPSLWSIGLDFNDDNDSQKSVEAFISLHSLIISFEKKTFFLLQNKFQIQ
jgi:hypothetical protein